MAAHTAQITETPNAFIVNGIVIPKMKKSQSNIYDPALIKAIGAALFFDLISPREPVQMPDLGFSDADWNEMEPVITYKTEGL